VGRGRVRERRHCSKRVLSADAGNASAKSRAATLMMLKNEDS
jgi:hypothetical protein